MLPMVDTPAETLWFDVVERRYKTIFGRDTHVQHQLWFDIERRYKTINTLLDLYLQRLWFDVERRYKTTT